MKETAGPTPNPSARVRHRPATVEGFIALIVAALVILSVFSSRHETPEFDTIEIEVSAGQSLWGIAEAYPLASMTTAQAADLIADVNGLSTSRITPGMTLSIPIQTPTGEYVAMR